MTDSVKPRGRGLRTIVKAALKAGLVALTVFAGSTAAPAPAVERAQAVRPAVALELFTSQSCSSCPPAEKLLRALSARGDVVALEWHVHYWDNLVHGRAGKWRDPFSDQAFTERQRHYNERLRGTRGVYTPQLVIGGRTERPGFARARIERDIGRQTGALDAFSLAMTRDGATLTIALDGPLRTGGADVWLVRFLKTQVTDVERGENHGRTLTNTHVVRGVDAVGRWSGGAQSFTANAPVSTPKEGCAVLVQEPRQGPVLFAGYCP